MLSLCAVLGEVSVGVKKGDWIEYKVTTTGTLEEGHDVTWARMEILDVQGTEISVNVSTRAPDGNVNSDLMVLDPGKGEVGVWFIIPANLNVGDDFFDASIDRNVTIEGSKQRNIAGAARTVTHSSTPERIKSWDRSTGVFIESIDVLQNFTLNAIVDKTNLWSAQIFGIDEPLFYAGLIGSIALLVIGSAIVVRFGLLSRRKRLEFAFA
jgi:hypothetical protein